MLASIHESALHPSHLALPFRLYGAMIGARVASEGVASKARVDKLMEMSPKYEEILDGSWRRRAFKYQSCNACYMSTLPGCSWKESR